MMGIREATIGLLTIALGVALAGWANERDNRIADEAVSAQMALDLEDANARAAQAEAAQRQYALVADVAQATLATYRRDAVAEGEQASEDRREAEATVATAGTTLDATLDSLAADPALVPIVVELRTQLGAERRARLMERDAQDREIAALAQMVAVGDSLAVVLTRRLDTTETALTETSEALRRANAAIASRTPDRAWHDAGWVKVTGIGLAMWAGWTINDRR